MKVSVIMATWNKHKYLPNALYSLARQKTSFPFEVCILDDYSDIDPEPIIRQFLPDVKYKRLDKQSGFIFSQGKCLVDLTSPDSDVILIQSDDIIHTQDDSIELICKSVSPKNISLAEVIDTPISDNLFKDFDNNIKPILLNWDSYKQIEPQEIDGIMYNLNTLYSGEGLSSWLFFLGAISRKDLEFLEFTKNNCDAVIGPKMKQSKFKVNYPPVRAIHQRHPKFAYPCPIVDSCTYDCIRSIVTYKGERKVVVPSVKEPVKESDPIKESEPVKVKKEMSPEEWKIKYGPDEGTLRDLEAIRKRNEEKQAEGV